MDKGCNANDDACLKLLAREDGFWEALVKSIATPRRDKPIVTNNGKGVVTKDYGSHLETTAWHGWEEEKESQ